MSITDRIGVRAAEAVIGLWFLSLGGTIGSFLNVVAYRLPRGKSLVTTPSSCPKCNTPILFRDNIPVLGWLLLRGRCRACQEPISPRYPIVEAFVALAFWLIFAVQLVSGGANIPFRTPPHHAGITWIISNVQWELVLQYLYHCVLLSSLFTLMLVDFDRQRIKWSARLIVAAILFLPIIALPELLPVPLWGQSSTGHSHSHLDSIAVCLVGGAVGILVGTLVSRTARNSQGSHLASGLCFVGMGLGWQAALSVSLIFLTLRLITEVPLQRLFQRPMPLTAYLVVGFLLHHPFWRWSITHLSPWWPGPQTSLPGWVSTIAALVALVLFNARIPEIDRKDNLSPTPTTEDSESPSIVVEVPGENNS